MKELENILINEFNKYPFMHIDDFVKLIYQHVNGGAHLINDEVKALDYLNREYDEVIADESIPLYEDIGNNIVRINLARFKFESLSVAKLFKAFVESSKNYHKDVSKMEESFSLLISLIENKKIAISLEEANRFLAWYRKENYPVISHSIKYVEQYAPHYRIISKNYLNELK